MMQVDITFDRKDLERFMNELGSRDSVSIRVCASSPCRTPSPDPISQEGTK